MNIETKGDSIFIDGVEYHNISSIPVLREKVTLTFIKKETEYKWPIGLPIINDLDQIHSIYFYRLRTHRTQMELVSKGWRPYWEYVFLFAPEWANWAAMDENGKWYY